MTRMTRPDCAVMCNLINTHTHTCSMGNSVNSVISVRKVTVILYLHINRHAGTLFGCWGVA